MVYYIIIANIKKDVLYGLKYIYVSTSVVFQWAELLTEGAFPFLKFRFRRPLNVKKKIRFFF